MMEIDFPVLVRKAFVPSPRACLHMALVAPAHYLGCECCSVESAGPAVEDDPDDSNEHDRVMTGAYEDGCIAYQVYQESGKMINLHDWHTAFAAIAVTGHGGVETDGTDAKRVYARFLGAVMEMQHMGYIKPTSRKIDHVMRLTWNGI